MKQHLRKYWFTYLLLIVCLIMLYWILSVPKPLDSHSTENAGLKKENAALRDSMAEFKKREAIDRRVIIQTDSAKKAIQTAFEVTKRELNKTKDNALQLAREIKELKSDSDTSELSRKAVDLAQQVENMAFLLDDALKQNDSLNILTEQQKITYEKMLTDRTGIINQIQTANNHLNEAYNGLLKDYSKVGKKLRIEKLKTKAAALIILAEAVRLFIAK